ncbi:hypothetical protein EW146_g4948 [Bondarzewia mesenterica]|uniref:Polyketide synthase-like phosphopantetheine-binding domain-containing protein n=1 Tax=Bondarzewia mesenterica TaxID=1095465 RepID=A0A4V3XEZ2_9AGAM|nr:hypothetical protein EW146_g4948 [Bondarzewia mesenterica]
MGTKLLQMILIAHPDKPFALTAKGNIRRGEVLLAYASEIEAAYWSFSNAPNLRLHMEPGCGPQAEQAFVGEVVREVMGRDVIADKDLFQQGCDSLQATRIRNILESSIRTRAASSDGLGLPQDVVYQYPTMSALSEAIATWFHPKADPPVGGDIYNGEMKNMVLNFTAALPPFNFGSANGAESHRLEDAVLITGTTGALGCHLLHVLAGLPYISRIYAFNRAPRDISAEVLFDRQWAAMESHGLDPSLLSTEKVVLLEADLTINGWAIDRDLMNEIRQRVSVIIHTAWKVDFKCKLPSFADCLAGLRALVDFALHGYIVKSVHSDTGLPLPSDVPDYSDLPQGEKLQEIAITDPSMAAGLGYTESKWVGERVLDAIAQERGLKMSIIRVGQLSGAENGRWKESEWFPTMVSSARLVECLPSMPGLVSWLPVSTAAKAIADVLRCDCQARYLNLSHPNPTTFVTIAEPLASALAVLLVPYDEWLAWLRKLRDEADKNMNPESAMKSSYSARDLRILSLVDFFGETDAMNRYVRLKGNKVGMDQILACSSSLLSRKESVLGKVDVERGVHYWRSVGLV